MTIDDVMTEFQRLDQTGADGYGACEPSGGEWPYIYFADSCVVRIHPDDCGAAACVLRKYDDGAANVIGPESFQYEPRTAFEAAGIRCKWEI